MRPTAVSTLPARYSLGDTAVEKYRLSTRSRRSRVSSDGSVVAAKATRIGAMIASRDEYETSVSGGGASSNSSGTPIAATAGRWAAPMSRNGHTFEPVVRRSPSARVADDRASARTLLSRPCRSPVKRE
jgi:hypothetical protein